MGLFQRLHLEEQLVYVSSMLEARPWCTSQISLKRKVCQTRQTLMTHVWIFIYKQFMIVLSSLESGPSSLGTLLSYLTVGTLDGVSNICMTNHPSKVAKPRQPMNIKEPYQPIASLCIAWAQLVRRLVPALWAPTHHERIGHDSEW